MLTKTLACTMLMTASASAGTFLCNDFSTIDDALREAGEQPVMIGAASTNSTGVARHVIYFSGRSKTYSVVEVYRDGVACLAAVGRDAEFIASAVQ